MLAMRFIVYGDVQGVGFRRTAQILAQKLQIVGYVRNLKDGSIEGIAQGSKNNIETFFAQIKGRFTVKEIKVEWSKNEGPFSRFSIY